MRLILLLFISPLTDFLFSLRLHGVKLDIITIGVVSLTLMKKTLFKQLNSILKYT